MPVEPRAAGRRNVRLITALIAIGGALLLFGTIYFAYTSSDVDQTAWQAPVVLALAISAALLTALLVREIIQRRRSERAFLRAERALQPVAHSVEDAPDEIQLPDVLDELVQRASSSLRTRWVAVLLSDDSGN